MKRPWTTYFLAGALGVLNLCLVGTLAVGSSTISPSIFDHAKHAETRPGLVTKDNCESCHKLQGKGANVLPVASVGHKPCLDSGCHASDFISVGESTRKSNPERFNRALAFCRGCHTWEGTGPSPHMAMKPNASYEKGEASDHHVEMDHFAHTKRTECASCHPTHTCPNQDTLNAPVATTGRRHPLWLSVKAVTTPQARKSTSQRNGRTRRFGPAVARHTKKRPRGLANSSQTRLVSNMRLLSTDIGAASRRREPKPGLEANHYRADNATT